MMKPPPKQSAAVNIALRGPTRSSQVPVKAAERPRNTIPRLKIQPSWVSLQSPGTDFVIPISRVIGPLKTENAYASPMQRCTQSAAGGTIQRLNPGLAMMRSRSKSPGFTPYGAVRSEAMSPPSISGRDSGPDRASARAENRSDYEGFMQ